MAPQFPVVLVALALTAAPAAAQKAEPACGVDAVSVTGRVLSPLSIAADRRPVLEANLARAAAEFAARPDDPDAFIWLGRRTAYLNCFREAIAIFSRGIERHPEDIRLYRHRGHRHITLRDFDKAIADFQMAARLIEERHIPDEVEPDGDPNPRNVPTSTTNFNVYYHLGLARYLQGDFEGARRAFRECMKYSQGSNDRLVATSDWLYMTLRRLGRADEAAALLAPITAGLDIIEDEAYRSRLLMYKGEKRPEELLGGNASPLDVATYGYGVANWYLYNGQPAPAREILQKIVAGPQWNAFGYIAAEVELARMK